MEVFRRIRLDSARARNVAQLRFGDAEALIRESRPNGAVYLAGLAVELLLKALLLDRNPRLAKKPESQLKGKEKRLWQLCWKEHDLGALFDEMPDIRRRLGSASDEASNDLIVSYNLVRTWTIFVRYSHEKASMKDACDFVSRAKELKPWLD